MEFSAFIAGAGGIGQAAGVILANSKAHKANIYIGDISQEAVDGAVAFIKNSTPQEINIHSVLMPKGGENEALTKALENCQVIMDCLPGSQAPRLARMAISHDCHYANLTEYVAETNEILALAQGAKRGFALQTGLAPGFINILACRLYNDFKDKYAVDVLEEMCMKVGALSEHAPSPHFYAFTWSPIGVATEYIKNAVVVKDYKTQEVPSLSGLGHIIIEGQMFEDNYTSGGAADLPQAFDGKVKDLHYKTLRHPGHYQWVKSVITDAPSDREKIDTLERTMLSTIGHVEEDLVVVYASVLGKDKHGHLRRLEKSYMVRPTKVGSQTLRAIQTTTAAPLCEMAVMMVRDNLSGTILQSQIDPVTFMDGEFVKQVYGAY